MASSAKPESTNTLPSTQEEQALSRKQKKENRSIITPYAFGVSEHLLGVPLASPQKRAIAIGIDMMLVGILTYMSELLFLGAFSWLCFVASNRGTHKGEELKGRKRKGLRFFGYLFGILFILGLFENVPQLFEQTDPVATTQQESQVPPPQTNQNVLAQDNTPKAEQERKAEEIAKRLVETFGSQEDITLRIGGDDALLPSSDVNTEAKPPSLLDWLKGILADLGISFGWAAAYFSVTTAWYKGQTPGKRLLGIKVIKLDGSGLGLWDSFGRYGGYGAGLATGLLGFVQIYWDANRQAIQDKISETLVIGVRK